jgi:DNA-binding CsgD family transcriptional regulator
MTTAPDRPRHYFSRSRLDLSPREKQVASLIARGRTNGEIATSLGIGFETAKTHVSAVIGKFGVSSREEVAAAWNDYQSLGSRFLRMRLAAAGWFSFKPMAVGAAVAGVAVVCAVAIAVAVSLSGDGTGAPRPQDPIPTAVAARPVPTALPGAWVGKADIEVATWTFAPDGKFTLTQNHDVYYSGTYEVDGNRVTIHDEQIHDQCEPGQDLAVYSWMINAEQLVLAPLDEPCPLRATQISGGRNLHLLP